LAQGKPIESKVFSIAVHYFIDFRRIASERR